MNTPKDGNGPSTEIKKCPYYDPVTRETMKPGKTCPEYNTPDGCPYAHPFEFDKWDGETPFGVPVAKADPDPSLNLPGSAQKAANDIDMPGHVGDGSGDMDLDDQHTQPSAPIQNAVTPPELSIRQTKTRNFIPPSQDPSSAPPLLLQKEAVEEFLRHLISAIQAYRKESIASAALAKFKADYKSLCHSYNESEMGESLQDIMSPGEKAAWIRQREKMTEELDDAESARWGWIDGLVSMDGRPQTSDFSRIGNSEDAEMKDAATVVVPAIVLTEEEDKIVDALNHHRARLQRGFVGDQVAYLRARMGRIRASMEKKARRNVSIGPSGGPIATNIDADTDMRDSEHPVDAKAVLRVAKNDLKRLEDLQEMAENMFSPIDEAEDWGTADIRGKWFEHGMRAAIEDITREFIQQEREQEAVDSNLSEVSSARDQAPRPMETMKHLKEKLGELTTIRGTSERLLQLIGPADLFDEDALPHFSFVLQNASKASETLKSDIDATFTPLSDRLTALTTLPLVDPTSSSSLVGRTTELHERHLGAHPSLLEARRAQRLSAHLPSQKEVQGQQRGSWFSEYEELKELCGKVVEPIVERTDKQEATLMELERGRRASVGGSVHGEDGGFVSMHASVEGAMS